MFASAPGTTGTGASRTPHHLLDGMITPNGLHFERHHSGIPDINPETHRLLIHGLVKRPLVYTLDALMRYPMESRIAFIECAGNSALALSKGTGPAWRPAYPWPVVLRRMDRRETRDASGGCRRRPARAVDTR